MQNPAIDNLQSKTPEALSGCIFSVVIYDLSGQSVFCQPHENRTVFNVNISSLDDGMYLLIITDNKKMYVQKFIVIKCQRLIF